MNNDDALTSDDKVPLSNSYEKPVAYNDRAFRIGAAFTVAFGITMYGGDESIFKLLLHPGFYIELGASLLFTVILIEWIAYATRMLDRKFDWRMDFSRRLTWQVILGIVVPSIVEFLFAAGYFAIFDVHILDTTFVIYAFPLIVMLILLFNAYYYVFYRHIVSRRLEERAGFLEGQLREMHPVTDEMTFNVPYGNGTIDIPFSDIAYFYHDSEVRVNYVYTFEGGKYLTPYTLIQIEEMVDKGMFFPISRKLIANHAAIKDYRNESYGKLEVFLEPKPPIEETPYTVSQNKRSRFAGWYKGK